MKIIPVIMSGGAGARLWPISREAHPKPFFKLNDGKSLLQHAFLRASSIANAKHILTITNQDLFFKTEDEFRKVNTAKYNCSYILEPAARDTAAATCAVSLFVQQHYGDDAIIVLFPADHMIKDLDGFSKTALHAIDIASKNRLVTFGIKPTYPETGYGYIEAEDENVIRFVEKPDLETAQQYLKSSRYFWNSGIFCFSAGTMVKLLREFSPEILEQVQKSIYGGQLSSINDSQILKLNNELFMQTPKNSIDYAVLEKAQNIAVVACDIGWTDIGSWTAVSELTMPNAEGNRTSGDTLTVNTENCYIHNSRRLIGTLGVKDLLIIDSEDALLVVHKNHTQDVKKVFAELKEKGHPAHSLHQVVYRPWGTYTVLEEGERFKIKRIEVKPKGSLSLHMHYHRSEHWIVVSGTAKVLNDEQSLILNTNESTYIPIRTKHRLENPGIMNLVIIEVQSGDYLGEDDIIRFDDMYGRV